MRNCKNVEVPAGISYFEMTSKQHRLSDEIQAVRDEAEASEQECHALKIGAAICFAGWLFTEAAFIVAVYL